MDLQKDHIACEASTDTFNITKQQLKKNFEQIQWKT